MSKVIQVGMFCRVMNSLYAEYGVKKNDVVYIAGDSIVSVSEADPYALRRLFIAAWMNKDHVDVDKGGFTIDGKNLKPCSKGKQERLDAVKEADFEGVKEAANEGTEEASNEVSH